MAMTKREAETYVREHTDYTADSAELDEVFRALYGGPPNEQDREEGLWSHCCAAIPQEICGACGGLIGECSCEDTHEWGNDD